MEQQPISERDWERIREAMKSKLDRIDGEIIDGYKSKFGYFRIRVRDVNDQIRRYYAMAWSKGELDFHIADSRSRKAEATLHLREGGLKLMIGFEKSTIVGSGYFTIPQRRVLEREGIKVDEYGWAGMLISSTDRERIARIWNDLVA